MKRIIALLLACMLCGAVYADDVKINKYDFRMYLLVKGRMIKKPPRPNFGYRILKTFPLRVKEFTFSAPYLVHLSKTIEEKAPEAVLSGIKEWRQKNAYHIANRVFEFVNNGIKERDAVQELSQNPHKLYRSGVRTLMEGEGNNLEKCRLAVSFLRHFTIPARIVYAGDHYAVEYFIRPLEGESGWFIMDFTGREEPEEGEIIEPVHWFPLDSKELLAEEWDGPEVYIRKKKVKNVYYTDKDKVLADFEKASENGAEIENNEKIEKKFFLIKIIDYEIWMKQGMSEENSAKITFTLPFNNRDTFKKGSDRGTFVTAKYSVKPLSGGLKLKYKRTTTRINPPQVGLVYRLPVYFWEE